MKRCVWQALGLLWPVMLAACGSRVDSDEELQAWLAEKRQTSLRTPVPPLPVPDPAASAVFTPLPQGVASPFSPARLRATAPGTAQ